MTTFRTVLRGGTGSTTGIAVPEELVLALGRGKRVPIAVTLGAHTYRTTVAPYRGEYMIAVSAENRAAAGIEAGDEVNVTMEVDDAPREVEVPEDLADALAADGLSEAFAGLSFSKKRAHVLSVEDAKTPETRDKRIAKVVDALR